MKIRLILALLAFSFAASAQHSNTLSWSWAQGTGDAATGYKVKKAATAGGPYTTVATLSGTAVMTFEDLVVVAGQTNYYVVTAFNAGGESVPSNQVTCTTPFQAPGPTAGLSAVSK